MKQTSRSWTLLTIALVLIIGGSLLAGWINTGGGTIQVKDVRYAGANALVNFARLYIPEGVTNESPAPGVLVIHGGDATNELMANIALELGRRGFVVLNIDQPGAGFSDAPSYANGMGGPAALQYIRSLDIVDADNVGIVGHSMGGAALSNAIAAYPDDYKALFFLDTRCELGPAMPCDFPVRNAMVNWGMFEEHPKFFYGVTFNSMVAESENLHTLFRTSDSIEPGVLYGSVEDGTAYKLGLTNDTHITVDDSPATIRNITDWFQLTLEGEKTSPPSNLIFGWKTLGTFAAFLGMMLLVFPLGALLLETPYFKSTIEPLPAFKGFTGRGWWIAATITTILAPITYVWAWDNMKTWSWLLPGSLWPQSQTNRYYLSWAILLGVITLVVLLVNHYFFTRKQGASIVNYGLASKDGGVKWAKIGKSFLLAIAILVPAYLLLAIVTSVLKVDFRLNFLFLRVLTPLRFQIFLGYLIPFVLFYLLSATMMHGFLRVDGGKASPRKEMLVNVAIMAGGMFVWLVIWYITLYSTGTPFYGTDSNFGIRALPLMILWPFLAMASTYFYRKTGQVYLGAFLMGTFITWYLAAASMISVVP